LVHAGARAFEMEFDLGDDALRIGVADGEMRRVSLGPQSVAVFYGATMQALSELELAVDIHQMQCEIPGAFAITEGHALTPYYNGDTARAYILAAMLQAQRVLQLFRSQCIRSSANSFLGYDAVRASADPDGDLLSFLQRTYEAAANLAQWNRAPRERPQGFFGRPPDLA
jgi:hypothetical protein